MMERVHTPHCHKLTVWRSTVVVDVKLHLAYPANPSRIRGATAGGAGVGIGIARGGRVAGSRVVGINLKAAP